MPRPLAVAPSVCTIACMFEVLIQPEAVAELEALRAFDRVRIVNTALRILSDRPHVMGGMKKRIEGERGSIYQLRVGEFRVFYDVDIANHQVVVRHVRRKGRRRTKEII